MFQSEIVGNFMCQHPGNGIATIPETNQVVSNMGRNPIGIHVGQSIGCILANIAEPGNDFNKVHIQNK